MYDQNPRFKHATDVGNLLQPLDQIMALILDRYIIFLLYSPL